MKTNQNNTNSQSVQYLESQLNDLLDKAKEVDQEIDETNKRAEETIGSLEAKIDGSVNEVEQIYSDLDQIEKEAGDEFDKLALQQAEDLAGEA